MLAGLLFATRDADAAPGRLVATLPFAGATLIEFQARQLIAAGASQIVVLVGRQTSELVGALDRIGRRRVALDPVRTAAEAAAKLHPLARLLVLADGLVTTDAAIAGLAREGGDTLLVTAAEAAPDGFERLGGGMAWAGVARLCPARVEEVAALPQDYDPQSTLLRVAEAAGAVRQRLGADTLGDGHAIEHGGTALGERARRLIVASVADGRDWFERWVTAPAARRAIPPLVARAVPSAALAAGLATVGAGAIGIVAAGWPAPGLILALLATIAVRVAAALARLRGEPRLARADSLASAVLPLVALAALGLAAWRSTGEPSAATLAMALVGAAVLTARSGATAGPGWGTPPAYLAIGALAAVIGRPAIGLLVAAVYAFGTLAAAVEVLRRRA